MAASGTYVFNPALADHIDEAFERCGIDPAELKARHVRSAIRSANLLFSDWETEGYNEYQLEFMSRTLTQGDNTEVLPTGGYGVFHMTLKRGGLETEMYQISRSDYNALHRKDAQGRPDRYLVDKTTFIGDTPASTLYLWQTPENSTDQLQAWVIKKNQDAGDPANDLFISSPFQAAFAAGMAYFLSMKFAPERTRNLKIEYRGQEDRTRSLPGGALGRALAHDRDKAPAVFKIRYGRRGGP